MTMRVLRALSEVSAAPNNTILFPLPMEIKNTARRRLKPVKKTRGV